MQSISLNIQCRPIRFGFLIRPGHSEDLTEAVEANTILWGGIYNPVIPYYKKITSIWKDKYSKDLTAKDIVKGYIANFQPDYIVKTFDENLPENIFPKDRVLAIKDVVSVTVKRQSPIIYGLDIMDVYDYAWRKVFRFVQKHSPKACLPTVTGSSKLLGCCLWGTFPEKLSHYGRDFCHIFNAKLQNYKKIETLLHDFITPISLTMHNLEPNDRPPDACVFVLDDKNLIDLIDFWNLRASGSLCIPWPISTLDKLTDEVREFMKQHLWKDAINDTKLTCPHLIYSRSVDNKIHKRIIECLALGDSVRLSGSYYHRFWLERDVNYQNQVVLFYSEEKFESMEVKDNFNKIDTLSPEFASRFGSGRPRWINVVSTNEHFPKTLPSNVIPDDLQNIRRAVGSYSIHGPWNCENGIAIPLEYKNSIFNLDLPDAISIGKQWFEEKGYECEISNSGHILQSMVDVIGGLYSGRWLADKDVLNSIEEMGSKGIIPIQRFSGALRKANDKAKINLYDKHLAFFDEKGIIKLASKIQCPHCRQHPFYILEELSHELTCNYCTRRFTYPITNPSNEWQYRTTGPFTASKDNQGAYSTLLSLRFVDDQLDARTTCIPSCKLKSVKGGPELEADFVCFWSNKHSWRDRGQYIIFGECKTNFDFEKKDVERMKMLASKFPGSIMAFCTLKNTLNNSEKRLLKQFAERGRKPKEGSYWPTPVLIIGANELYDMMPQNFRHKTDQNNKQGLATHLHRYDFSMLDLCEASQKYYLDLPSRHDWITQYYKKRQKNK